MPVDTTPGPAGPDASGLPPGSSSRGRRGRGRHAAPSRANRTWLIVIGIVVMCLAGAGVALAMTSGKKKGTSSSVSVASSTSTTAPPGVCPLTGAPPPGGGSVPERSALAIKVDNYPQARPQSGIDKADIVFEEPVEGRITRLVAVFQCQTPALVGDIRSARAPDVPISDLLSHPLFVHVGGIAPVLALVKSANLTDVDLYYLGSLTQQPAGRVAPYDIYTSPAAVWAAYPTAATPPAPVFTYSSSPVGGTPAATAHIPFSSTNDNTWTWNAGTDTWALAFSGEPATVSSGAQIATSNVVIMTVSVTYGPWVENEEGGLEVQAQMTGSGPVTVLRNGQQITGTWSRPSLGSPMTLTSSTGQVIALNPGQTWVEIVPNYVTVTITPPASTTTSTSSAH